MSALRMAIDPLAGRGPLVWTLTIAWVGWVMKGTDMKLEITPTAAVTLTDALVTVLDRFTVAMPPVVGALAAERVPVPEETAKLTMVPSGTEPGATPFPPRRKTLALMATGVPVTIPVVELAVTLISVTRLASMKAIAAESAEAPPLLALTTTEVPSVVLVRITLAAPLTVAAEGAERMPAPLLTVKSTGVPSGTAMPFTVAWAVMATLVLIALLLVFAVVADWATVKSTGGVALPPP